MLFTNTYFSIYPKSTFDSIVKGLSGVLLLLMKSSLDQTLYKTQSPNPQQALLFEVGLGPIEEERVRNCGGMEE